MGAAETEARIEGEFRGKVAEGVKVKVEGERTDKRRNKWQRAKEAKRRKENMRAAGIIGNKN